MLADFASLRRGRVELGAVSKLIRTEVFSNVADAAFHVIAVQVERLVLTVDPTKGDMNMWVFRVVMRNRDPFEMTITKVAAHSRHQLAGQTLHDRLDHRIPGRR